MKTKVVYNVTGTITTTSGNNTIIITLISIYNIITGCVAVVIYVIDAVMSVTTIALTNAAVANIVRPHMPCTVIARNRFKHIDSKVMQRSITSNVGPVRVLFSCLG